MNAIQTIDILMITCNRPVYTRLALTRLLETCDPHMRVWLWHNGPDVPTLEVVQSLARHPRVYNFHHSPENRRLTEPTNWFWGNAQGDLLGKVDDDCLVPHGWAEALRAAHRDVPTLGAVGCWSYLKEDFDPQLAGGKIMQLPGGHRLFQNLWVGGSGYLIKRACVQQQGLLAARQSFTNYCIHLAARGWRNGWYFPLLLQEHMDDPRSPNTLLKSDDDMALHAPLSAKTFGVRSLKQWEQALRTDAYCVMLSSLDPRSYIGLGAWLRRLGQKFQKAAAAIFPVQAG